MPYLELRPHISFVRVEDRAIFLDLRRDRYFALDRDAADAFDALCADPGGCLPDDKAAILLASGLFDISDAALPLPEIQLPEALFGLTGALPAPRIGDVLQTAFLVIRAGRLLRTKPLERIIARLRSQTRDSTAYVQEATLALTRRFLSARSLVPVAPTCLLDSLALHAWLANHGTSATMVVGVRLDPFAAHCWVQLGNTVLNDAPDRTSTYSPILVVE